MHRLVVVADADGGIVGDELVHPDHEDHPRELTDGRMGLQPTGSREPRRRLAENPRELGSVDRRLETGRAQRGDDLADRLGPNRSHDLHLDLAEARPGRTLHEGFDVVVGDLENRRCAVTTDAQQTTPRDQCRHTHELAFERHRTNQFRELSGRSVRFARDVHLGALDTGAPTPENGKLQRPAILGIVRCSPVPQRDAPGGEATIGGVPVLGFQPEDDLADPNEARQVRQRAERFAVELQL